MRTTTIKLEPFYKEKYVHLTANILLAIVTGPFLIFALFHTAVTNNVDDLIGWAFLGIASLLFAYLSYGKFKYIYFTYLCEHSAEIDFKNKTILFMPYNETILIEKVTAFSYSKKFKKYIFMYTDRTNTFFELKPNPQFENALKTFALTCNAE